jgi:hypothetical protein
MKGAIGITAYARPDWIRASANAGAGIQAELDGAGITAAPTDGAD